uniref:Uncharacterized protein n=1 Tax=Canis lupus familiaris TaxID=9615 RepID=A0A8C0S893_CANLF
MPPRKPLHETYPQGTRSFSEICSQAPCRPDGPDLTRSSSPPQPRQNCWDIRHGCTSTTLNGHPQVSNGPPRWWDPPNSAWLGLLLILLLSPPIQAVECDCMKGSGTSRYFSSYTHMPRTCYSGKTPITCTSRHAEGTFWMSELSQTIQDQAGQEQTRQRVIHQLQTSNQLTYKSISLDDIKKVPTTEQLTTALLNSSYNLWRNLSKTGDSNCWICFPFSTLSNIVGIPLPTNWTLPNSTITNQTVHIGPIGGNIPIINSSNSLTPVAANITNSSLPYCAPSGIFLSCPQGTYRCLTANDSLDCTFILLSPSTNIYSDSQLQSTLFLQYRRKRAAFLPFLIGAGITTGVATGVAGMGTSIDFYYKLSQALNDDMERIADSLTALQTQVTSLAAVTLQNRRALDLLTAEKGGTCLYLNEECCYFVNQSGIVTSKVKELRDRIQTRRQGSSFWGLDPHTWVTWLLPLAGPLCLILLLISVAPCLFRCLQERLQELTRVSVNQLLLHPYSRLPTSDYPYNDAPPSGACNKICSWTLACLGGLISV